MNGDTLFLIGLAALAYAYAGYPILLALLAPILGVRIAAGEFAPSVSIVLAAHNEKDVIEEKVENTLRLDYPPDLLQLVIVSDASDDGTDEIVSRYAESGVLLVRQEPQAGKSAALNRGLVEASGEIIVFCDANSMFSVGAIRELVAPFADARIGAVSGALIYEADAARSGEALYWRYEQVVKRLESKLGRLLGANVAIRRELVPELHPLEVNDFRIPYEALLRGWQVVVASKATATERAAPSVGGEMARKVRIMGRALPMFFNLLGRTLAAGRPLVAWQLVSHKISRETQSVFFLSMLAGAVWAVTAGSALGSWLLGVQVVGYGLGVAGWAVSPLRRALPIRICTYVTMIAVTSVWAMGRWMSGRNRATWTGTERLTPSGRDSS
jgi:cellulose synthase/poly-beta-1,6-N-acetylglucosamine synthase-like glycosyltransferase